MTTEKKNGNGGRQLAKQEPSVALMLQKIIEGGVTEQSVGALEKMVGLYERMNAKEAERQFNEAFCKLQSEMPGITATKPVPNKDGTVRYRFAPYEELMEKVQPLLTKHGFSISFNSRFDNGRMIAVCNLRHIGGHSQANEFAVRIGGGPPGATETQADGAAKTYAKRGALADALNIVVEHDDDARMVGKPIGRALAEDLMNRIQKLGDQVDEQAFLKFAGVAASSPAKIEDYMLIGDDRYDYLEEMLQKKEVGPQSGKKKSTEKRDPESGEFQW